MLWSLWSNLGTFPYERIQGLWEGVSSRSVRGKERFSDVNEYSIQTLVNKF